MNKKAKLTINLILLLFIVIIILQLNVVESDPIYAPYITVISPSPSEVFGQDSPTTFFNITSSIDMSVCYWTPSIGGLNYTLNNFEGRNDSFTLINNTMADGDYTNTLFLCNLSNNGTWIKSNVTNFFVDSINITRCRTLSIDRTYLLKYDISHDGSGSSCINIQRDSSGNIKIDCQGFNINGYSDQDYGIYVNELVSGLNHAIIENCNITNFDTAIRFNGNRDYNIVSNCHLSKNNEGIESYGSDRNKIHNSTIIENDNYGLRFTASQFGSIIFNTIILNNSVYDIFLDQQTLGFPVYNITFVNSTFSTFQNDMESWYIREWYYNLFVNNSIGNPINKANVTVYNSTNDKIALIYSNSNGRIINKAFISYYAYPNEINYSTPHTFNVSYPGYIDNITIYNLTNNIYSFVALSSILKLNITSPLNLSYLNYNTSINLNYSILNTTNLDTCFYSLDNLITNKTINQCLNTTFNITEGNSILIVGVNNSLGESDYFFVNFTTDLTYPDINISKVSTTQGGLSVLFNSSFTESNCNNSFYSVFKLDGSIENSLENISLSCNNMNNSFTVTDFSSYNLSVYVNDKAGNINSTTKSFTTSAGTVIIQGGGGSSTTIVIGDIPATNYSVLTTSFGTTLDFALSKNSVAPREKTFILVNRGIDEINVQLVCDVSLLEDNETDSNINICDYISFPQSNFTLPAVENDYVIATILVETPPNASIGDKYLYNILALHTEPDGTRQYARLSVVNRVTLWAEILKMSFLPLQGDTDVRKTYPVSIFALAVAFVFFILIFAFTKKKYPVAGFIVAGLTFIGTFFTILILL